MKPFSGMSLKSTSGTSLVEVMVMMVILWISIVGIYTMVDSGKQLATLTDTRLNAVNIAREGLESVTTLRDTFALKGYESSTCSGANPNNVGAFFTIDGSIILDTNCPIPFNIEKPYILTDDKTLTEEFKEPTNFDLCINEFGWYSQEWSMSQGSTVDNCSDTSPGSSCSCANTLTLCETNTTKSCKTRFKRKITFKSDSNSNCGGIDDSQYCVEVFSHVWWGTDSDDTNTSIALQQIITPLD